LVLLPPKIYTLNPQAMKMRRSTGATRHTPHSAIVVTLLAP